jgi:DNA invertase Pin-like site-specific DNA recombinase
VICRSSSHCQSTRRGPESHRATDRYRYGAGKCFLDMLGVFAEFETNLRRERQLERITKAKAAGVHKGRPPSIEPSPGARVEGTGHEAQRHRQGAQDRPSLGVSSARTDSQLRKMTMWPPSH